VRLLQQDHRPGPAPGLGGAGALAGQARA
jgi:hypothetical protein